MMVDDNNPKFNCLIEQIQSNMENEILPIGPLNKEMLERLNYQLSDEYEYVLAKELGFTDERLEMLRKEIEDRRESQS